MSSSNAGPNDSNPQLDRPPVAPASLRAVLEHSPEAGIVIDAERRIRYVNPASERRFGWNPDALLGEAFSCWVHNGDPIAEAPQARGSRSAAPGLVEVRDVGGRLHAVSLLVAPIELAGFRGALLTLRDESDRSRLELTRRNAELEQSVRAVSHDLRSPLVAVLGFSRLLRDDYAELLDEKGRHFLERIELAAHTMESLLRDFLELSRIDQERGTRPAPTDPRPVLLQLEAEMKPRLDEADVQLVLPSHPPMLRCSRTRIYQLFSNLIGNALDHMGPTTQPTVRVRIAEEPGRHHIVVADNGGGVDPQNHERIFEPFRGRSGEGGRSTGIGLAIVRKIAEVHGGQAWVESRAGEGAAFHVTLATS